MYLTSVGQLNIRFVICYTLHVTSIIHMWFVNKGIYQWLSFKMLFFSFNFSILTIDYMMLREHGAVAVSIEIPVLQSPADTKYTSSITKDYIHTFAVLRK